MLSHLNSSQAQIRILVVDDQVTIREALHLSLKKEPDFEIVGSASNGEMALIQIEKLHPDITLLDIEMPGLDGLTILRQIEQRFHNAKVLMLSSHNQPDFIQGALLAGAKGYLMKTTPVDDLAQAIRSVYKGYSQFGPGLLEKFESDLGRLPSDAHRLQSEDSKTLNHQGELGILVPSVSSIVIQSITEEWSTIVQEHLESLPRVWIRGLFYLILIFTVVLLPWAMLAKVDETGSARGRLQPGGSNIRLDAPVAGTVTTVYVQEGQHVQEGQVLLELDSALLQNDLQQAQTRLEGLRNRLSQLKGLESQLIMALNTQAQQNQSQLSAKQSQIDQARQTLQQIENNSPLQLAEKRAQVYQFQQALTAVMTNSELTNKTWQIDRKEVGRYQYLWQNGAISESKVLEVQRKADESWCLRTKAVADIYQAEGRLKEELNNEQKLVQQIKSETQQAKYRLQEQYASYQSLKNSGKLSMIKNQEQLQQMQSQVTSIQADIRQNTEQIKALQFQSQERVFKAPVSGTIFQLPVTKAKAFVQTGQLVAQIAPQDSTLILKAMIPNQDSGFLKVGMPVKLKFDAYRFQDYGIVPGRLSWISPDAKLVETSSQQGEMFEIEVMLNQTYIQMHKKQIPLTPGLTATAEVVIRQRRIIDFILDPFRQLEVGGVKL
jgi:hemolysin D